MQHLLKATHETLNKLGQLLGSISTEAYNSRPTVLNGSSVGEHCRHLLEMFLCLDEGYEAAIINYETRKRDAVLEQDKNAALNCLQTLLLHLSKPEKSLVLQTKYNDLKGETEACETSYTRELTYVLEHSVHHMAFMAVGVKIAAPDLILPENFDVAASTIKYRKACAQ